MNRIKVYFEFYIFRSNLSSVFYWIVPQVLPSEDYSKCKNMDSMEIVNKGKYGVTMRCEVHDKCTANQSEARVQSGFVPSIC